MSALGEMYSFYTSLAKSLISLAFARLYKPQQIPSHDLAGQTAVVTGANSGIISRLQLLLQNRALLFTSPAATLIVGQQRLTMSSLNAMERAKQE